MLFTSRIAPVRMTHTKKFLRDVKLSETNEVKKVRTVSHLIIELWALVVVQDGCICTAGEERVSWLAIDALKGKASLVTKCS